CSHVDGTGRVQSVSRDANPAFYDVIDRFGHLTGVPVVLNTSFNLRGEPMVHRPGEAVNDFLRSDMDSLVLGPYVADKPAS
ncbi:MAG TPA: carbamoyltransferase C-terminal domain-containing protein, partial [Acidimicrobiales bacterium]|nr:carbamoyltransferase C-terminal domain-containing protein [Acidimicrobiales bacterium]